jgi:hypothetical protein
LFHFWHRHVTSVLLCWGGGSDGGTFPFVDPALRLPLTLGSLSPARAAALASRLDVDLDDGICFACLSFVSFAVDDGDERDVARQLRRMTPDLWADGLAETALGAARRACEGRVPDADAALADLERHGGRSVVARALVRRLAEELSRRTRTEMQLEARARDRLRLAPPELN